MPKILMLNDTRDQPNWGSQACAEALVQIMCQRVPNAKVDTLPHSWLFNVSRRRPHWLGGRLSRLPRVGRYLDRNQEVLLQWPSIADEFDHMAEVWLSGRAGASVEEFIARARASDAVVFNAEGSTYRVNHAAVVCLFMLWFAKTWLHVPALFLNGTVALTNVDRILPGIVRKTFQELDGIAVREPTSLNNVKTWVPGVDVRLVPDSVFCMSPQDADQASPQTKQFLAQLAGKPYFCLSSSMLPLDYKRSHKQSALVLLIQQLQRLVPQAVLTAKDVGDRWLEEVAADTGALYFGPEHSYQGLMSLLGGAQFLASGRYHNIILATIMGCPSLPFISSSPKIDGLCELLDGAIGQPVDVTDIRPNIPQLVERAAAYLEHRAEMHTQLQLTADRLRAATFDMGDMVQAAITHRQAAIAN